jgi:hypothetical protein
VITDIMTYAQMYFSAQMWADTDALQFYWPFLGALILGPVIGVVIHWKLALFRRSQAWKRWRIYHAWQAYKQAGRERE